MPGIFQQTLSLRAPGVVHGAGSRAGNRVIWHRQAFVRGTLVHDICTDPLNCVLDPSPELQRRGDVAFAELMSLRAVMAERELARSHSEDEQSRLQALRAEEQLRAVREEIASLRCVTLSFRSGSASILLQCAPITTCGRRCCVVRILVSLAGEREACGLVLMESCRSVSIIWSEGQAQEWKASCVYCIRKCQYDTHSSESLHSPPANMKS